MQYRINIDVFPLSNKTAEAANELGERRSFSRCRITQHEGGLQHALAYYADHPSPELIIVEDDSDISIIQERLDQLAQEVEPGRKVIVIGKTNDIAIYRRIVAMGVADYLVAPINMDTLVDSAERALHDPSGPQLCRYIAVTGARGGVGSSSIAHNLAWAYARKAKLATILVDLDLTRGTAALAFNQDVRLPLANAFEEPERLDSTLLERYMVSEDDYLRILSTNGELRHHQPIDETGMERVVSLCRQMAKIVILDIPHLWTEWIDDLLIGAHETIVVATPDLANIRDARNLVDYLQNKRGEARLPRLIINKADIARKTRLLAKDISSTLGIDPLATIPFEPALFIEAANEGKMIGEQFKNHKLVGVFANLAAQLNAGAGKSALEKMPKRRPSFFRPWATQA